MKQQKEIPVYVFAGFLEGGKTSFIQTTMEDKKFNDGERTLLLICEEGEVEFDLGKFYGGGKNVTTKVIDDEDDLNEETLDKLCKMNRIERVVVEYNGMWLLQSLFEAMPEDWAVYQVITLADSNTFEMFNQNMRQLVFDKLSISQMVAFNRMDGPVTDESIMPLHKIVRGISRQIDIVYEQKDGTIKIDEIVDPLPFDKNASVIDIADKDYALFLADLDENPKDYENKSVRFKGICATNDKMPEGNFVCGRHVMQCCAADITYMPILCKVQRDITMKNGEWAVLEGKLNFKFSPVYRGKGPIITVKSLTPCEPPEEKVATMY